MKGYKLALACAIVGFVGTVTFAQIQAPARPAAAPPAARHQPPVPHVGPVESPAMPADPRPTINKYCTGCHNSKAKIGGLALDGVDTNNVGTNTETWEAVVRKVRTGAMPPVGRPRPDKATADGMVAFLETSLDSYATAHPNPGRPSLHR